MTCTVLTALCFLFTRSIVSVFLTDASALEYAVRFSRIMLTTSWLFGVYYVLINAMQAVGAAFPSFIASVCRQGFIYIPALFILQAAMGMDGLVWAQPVADLLSLLMTAVLYFYTMKKCRWTAAV